MHWSTFHPDAKRLAQRSAARQRQIIDTLNQWYAWHAASEKYKALLAKYQTAPTLELEIEILRLTAAIDHRKTHFRLVFKSLSAKQRNMLCRKIDRMLNPRYYPKKAPADYDDY